MPEPRKTPFDVFKDRTRPNRPLRLTHDDADATASEPVAHASPSARSSAPRNPWMRQPVRLHLTPRAMLLGGLALILAVIVAYEIGHSSASSAQRLVDQRSTQQLADLRREPVNGLLLRTDDNSQNSAPDADSPGVSPPATSPADSADPRTPGYNYFCLATMPPKYRAEAERAVAFLKRNRVDAAIFSVDNHWLQVVALRGFDSASSPQAKEYQSLLRSLGRAWKAEQRGWSDWSDLYAIKYKP